MPYYIYQNEKYFISHNMIQCQLCKEVIETRLVNHFVYCGCHRVALSGGLENPGLHYGNAMDVSIWKTKDGKQLPAEIVKTMFVRN